MNDFILYSIFIIFSAVVINFIVNSSKKIKRLLNDQEYLESTIIVLNEKLKKIENDIYEAYKRLPPLNK